jgi:hypothetical protein
MQKFYNVFIILIFLSIKIHAQNNYTLKMGANFSSLRDERSKYQESFLLEIEKNWKLLKYNSISIGMSFVNKRGILKRKTIAYEEPWMSKEVFYRDINFNIHYIEIPILLKHYFYLSKQFKLQFNSGVGYSIAYKDRSTFDLLFSIPLEDDNSSNNFNYDYFPANEYKSGVIYNSGALFRIGTGMEWKYLIIESCYTIDLHKTKNVKGMSIKENIKSFQLLAGLKF